VKLATWNVNGIRSAHRHGFADWMKAQRLDIVCVQETKAREEQLAEAVRHPGRYHGYWHSARKPGYSGVALFSKREPTRVSYGLGTDRFDAEGRVLIAEFSDFTLVNAYFPHSQHSLARLPYKLAFCRRLLRECRDRTARGEDIVMCGDFNIAHQEIDLAHPRANRKNPGFLPQERAWMDRLLGLGFRDGFRHFVQDGGHYTWWSQRRGVRERNIGWRIDTFVVSEGLVDRLRGAENQTRVRGSDHCPVVLSLND
jgi:exodeoxyribonuclease-3